MRLSTGKPKACAARVSATIAGLSAEVMSLMPPLRVGQRRQQHEREDGGGDPPGQDEPAQCDEHRRECIGRPRAGVRRRRVDHSRTVTRPADIARRHRAATPPLVGNVRRSRLSRTSWSCRAPAGERDAALAQRVRGRGVPRETQQLDRRAGGVRARRRRESGVLEAGRDGREARGVDARRCGVPVTETDADAEPRPRASPTSTSCHRTTCPSRRPPPAGRARRSPRRARELGSGPRFLLGWARSPAGYPGIPLL